MRGHAVKLGCVLLLALAVWPGTGWAQSSGSDGPSASASALTLRPGDVVRITVWPNTELSGEFVIEETGYVYLPILEAVRVAGVPIDQLRAELRRGYGEAMRNPVVSVTPVFSVTVMGAVQRPGVYTVTPAQTLFDVLGMAGGFQASAEPEKLRIVRPGEVVRFDALRALERGEGLHAVQLRSGDQIVVPARRPPFNWRNVLTMIQTFSLLWVTYERIRR